MFVLLVLTLNKYGPPVRKAFLGHLVWQSCVYPELTNHMNFHFFTFSTGIIKSKVNGHFLKPPLFGIQFP